MGPPGWNPADPDDPRRSGGLQRAQEGLHTGDVGSRRAHARFVSAGGMPAHGVHGACVRAGNIPGRHVRARDRMDLHVIGAGAQRNRLPASRSSRRVRGSHSGSGARAAAVRPQPSISACARSACSRAIQARQTFPSAARGPPAARRRRPGPAVPPRPPPPPSGARASAAARGGQRHVPCCTKAVTRAPGASPPARQGCAAWPIAARSCPSRSA